jgi:chromate transporter
MTPMVAETIASEVAHLDRLLPGLVVMIALSALFLASGAPLWVRAAGAGAAVPAVAFNAAS